MDDAVIAACQELEATPAWRRIRAHLLSYASTAADSGVRAGRYDVIGLIDRYGAIKLTKEKRVNG